MTRLQRRWGVPSRVMRIAHVPVGSCAIRLQVVYEQAEGFAYWSSAFAVIYGGGARRGQHDSAAVVVLAGGSLDVAGCWP